MANKRILMLVGDFVDATYSNAVVDGNLVTAAAWPEWMRKFLAVLGTKIEP